MVDKRKRRRSRSRSRSVSKRPAVELDEAQRQEAERIAAIAKRAEERAAERQLKEVSSTLKTEDASIVATSDRKLPLKIIQVSPAEEDAPVKLKFRSKAQRQKDALEKLEKKRQEVIKTS